MSDAGAAAQAEAQPSLVERLSGIIAMLGGLLSLCVALLVVSACWAAGSRACRGPMRAGVFGSARARQRRLRDGADGDGDRHLRFLPYTPGPPRQHRGRHLHHLAAARAPIACIDAFWDLVYAGMMGAPHRLPGRRHARALSQRPDHHAAADHRLAGDRHLHRASVASDLRRAGDGGQACCGGGHERSWRLPPSALA